MKSIVTAAVLALAGLAGAPGADAQEHRGPDRDHHRVEHHRRNRPQHRRERIWVPARYESRFSGYDRCGKPVYRSVCVAEGRWTFAPDRCD